MPPIEISSPFPRAPLPLPFDPGAAAQLRDLLRAAAAYAAGGREALRLSKSGGASLLLSQMK